MIWVCIGNKLVERCSHVIKWLAAGSCPVQLCMTATAHSFIQQVTYACCLFDCYSYRHVLLVISLSAGLVFEGIGFFDVGVAVFLGNYRKLTTHLVSCSSPILSMSHTDVLSFLTKQLQPIKPGSRPLSISQQLINSCWEQIDHYRTSQDAQCPKCLNVLQTKIAQNNPCQINK